MARGIVYCLTNPAMPGLVKIGRVENSDADALKKRLSSLYTSSMPYPFTLRYAVVAANAKKIEGLLHDAFADSRNNPRREFFEIAYERVIAAMQLTGGKEIYLDDKPDSKVKQADIDARNRLQQREDKKLSAFKFSYAEVPIGAEITFVRDSEITAKVVEEKQIVFRGETTSLSNAATIVLRKTGQRGRYAGPQYWEYEGETLAARRARIQREREEAEPEPDE